MRDISLYFGAGENFLCTLAMERNSSVLSRWSIQDFSAPQYKQNWFLEIEEVRINKDFKGHLGKTNNGESCRGQGLQRCDSVGKKWNSYLLHKYRVSYHNIEPLMVFAAFVFYVERQTLSRSHNFQPHLLAQAAHEFRAAAGALRNC